MMLIVVSLICFVAVASFAYLLYEAGSKMYTSYKNTYISSAMAMIKNDSSGYIAENLLTIKILLASLFMLFAYLIFSTAMMPVPIITTIIGFILGWIVPDIIIKRRKIQRQKKLNSQLIDMVTTLSNGLRSGFSLMQALKLASRQMPDPIGQELKITNHEIELGIRIEDALQNLASRVNDKDLFLIVASIMLVMQTGGDLPVILKQVANTIRERNKIERKVNALTSQGRLQAIIVGLIPIALGIIIHIINPELMSLMYTTAIGWVLIAIIVMLDFLGYYVIRQIVTMRSL